MFAVMLLCAQGWRLNHEPLYWERTYSWVTWVVEDTEAEARAAFNAIDLSKDCIKKKVVPYPVPPEQYYSP